MIDPLTLAYIHHLTLGNVDAAMLCAQLIASNH
jgi:hypothetical protein